MKWESILLPGEVWEEEESEYLLNYNLINHGNVISLLQIGKQRSLAQSAIRT